MYKLRPFVNQNIMLSVYYSLIYPHFIYGIQVWGSSFASNLKVLETLQKKVVRLITHNDNPYNNGEIIHSLPLFSNLGLLKISEIYKLQISKFIYDCLHNYAPQQFTLWYHRGSDLHDHETRTNNDLFIPYGRTTHYGLKSIKIQGSKIWNEIPLNIREINSRNLFNKKLKLKYISDYVTN